MKIMSWNVNSVRVRHDRLLALLDRHAPDVLCLQELKTEDKGFPFEAIRAAGYHAVTLGQKTYNGVALLSRTEPTEVLRGLDDGVEDPQARLISARYGDTRVVCVYVPNGGEMGSEKWAYKQAWYARLVAWLSRNATPGDALALCGDFNVSFDDRDVKDPAAWVDGVLYHPDARALLNRVVHWGLVDTFRQHQSEGGHYSWWDYRGGAWQKNDGLRIDFILATKTLAARCTAAGIDTAERKPPKKSPDGKDDNPSDHAPIWAEFGDAAG
jgi:exodeoxyribonuclease-3